MESDDRQRVLVVLKAKDSDLKSSDSYLKKRGWTLISKLGIKGFLKELFSGRPVCALINISHSYPRVRQLHSLVEQALKIPVIVYCGDVSAAGQRSLKDLNHKYTLYPPVSGPAIERMLLRVAGDMEGSHQQELRESINSPIAKSSGNDYISIAGDGKKPDSDKTAIASAREQLVKIFESEGQSQLLSATQDGSNLNLGMTLESPIKAREIGRSGKPFGGQDPSSISEESSKSVTLGMSKSGLDSNLMTTVTAVESEAIASSESILTKAAESALARSSRIFDSGASEKISNCRNVNSFYLNQAGICGYLIVAFGTDRKIDPTFLESVRNHIVEFMNKNGQAIIIPDAMDLRLEEVPFEEWSLAEAQFLRKSIHEGTEVALAFFPMEYEEAPLELSDDHQMLKLNIDELSADQAIGFDLYLHMPVNKKYIRYTARERIFYGYQKTKLQSSGVRQMHVRQACSAEVSRYRLVNFLNEKISAYNDRKKAAGRR